MKLEAAGPSSMPTAAKLVGALVLATACWAMVDVIMFRYPDYREPGIRHWPFALVGLFVGWKFVGKRAEQGYRAAWSAGFAGAFVAAFWIALIMACYGVFRGMGYHAYKSVPEMIDGFIKLFAEYGLLLTDVPFLLLVMSGGVLSGIFAGFAGRLWR